MQRRWLNARKFLLRMTLPVLRKLPLPVASRMIAGIGHTEYRHMAELRETFQAAVTRAGQSMECEWDIPAVSFQLAGNQIRWRLRDFLLDGVSDRRALPMFVVQGRENLDGARAQGKGVIMLACHYGAHLLPAHWLFRQKYPLRFYMERPRHTSKFMAKEFATDGPLGQDKLFISRRGDPAGAAGSILRAARILKAGMLVYLAGDVRWTGPHTVAARFLGREFTFSATWVNLAGLTGAPVVPVFCQMRADGRYEVDFRPGMNVPADAVRSGRAGEWVQTYLSQLEEQVRRFPENSNEYFFWTENETQAA